MTKYAVCPNFFEICLEDKVKFKDVLFKFVQTNHCKILLDKEKTMLDRYRMLNDPHGYFGFWLDLLSSCGEAAFFTVSTPVLISTLENNQAMVLLASSFAADRNLVTVDEDSYAEQFADIQSQRITLIDAVNIVSHMEEKSARGINVDKLARDLIDQAKIILEKKFTREIEDIYNDEFSSYLRGQGYFVSDQTRSGISPGGINPGEIDIMIRANKTGAPECIIESFVLDSCGPKNTVVSSHINKLLSHYDTSGFRRNFVLVFSRAKDFSGAWSKYLSYVGSINSNDSFSSAHSLLMFVDDSDAWDCPANIKVGIATHKRCDARVELFHIFINMYRDG